MIGDEVGITEEDVQAYNELCAIQVGRNHHRLKLKAIANRSRDAAVGRALVGGKLHLRLDTFGNPEIVYDKKDVIVRFVIGGMKFYVPHWYDYRAIGSLYSLSIEMYTDYQFKGHQDSIQPKDILEQAKDNGVKQHDSYGFPRRCDEPDCRICTLTKEAHELVEIQRQQYDAFITSKTMKPSVDSERGKDWPLIPYSSDKEMNMERIPDILETEWGKIAGVSPRTGVQVRSWKRREK